MKSYRLDDGRWYHKFRQSTINTFDTCPERARLEDTHRVETDAACVGTATHSAIEYGLEQWHSGQAVHLDELKEVGHRELEAMEFELVKWKTMRGPRDFLDVCVRHWYEQVLPTLPDKALTEVPFELKFYEDDQRVIWLSGTIDYVPAHYDSVEPMKDWKTSGRGPYEKWEYQRWAIQPTVYTWAAAAMGLLPPTQCMKNDPDCCTYCPEMRFEYVVLGRHGVQRFIVNRGERDWLWLRQKVLAMASLIEADLATWPKQDNHALCSEKWCPAWATCKGAAYLVAA